MRKIWILISLSIIFMLLIGKFPFFSVAQEDEICFWNLNQTLEASEDVVIDRDTQSDDSYQKFLDGKHPFLALGYIPADLAPIESDFTANNARKFQLRKEVWILFADMAWHFQDYFKGKKKLSITSAYRSFTYQQQLLKSYCRNKNQCANAWSSEHQAGLAMDLGTNGRSLDKASLERLQTNAHKRGFHQSYQKGTEIDGKMVEPRHWRYLGETLATELYEKKLTFTEWFYSQGTRDRDTILSGKLLTN